MKRWGILGTSFISGTMAEAINNNPDSILQAIAGRRVCAVADFAKQYNVNTSYSDYEQLITDKTVDIIYIALPNHLHHKYVQKALSANKHVLCEKSLSVDMSKTEIIANAVKNSTQCFMEGLMYISHPLFKTLIELLKSNIVGKIKKISANYCVDIAQFVNQDGGGVIYNLGCYPISSVHYIMQTIYGPNVADSAQLSASGKLDSNNRNIVDATLNMHFSNQVSATIYSSEILDDKPQFIIEGDKGTISLVSNLWLPNNCTNQLKVIDLEGNSKIITVDSSGDAFFYQIEKFIKLIDQSSKKQNLPYPTIDDSKNIMKTLTTWQDLIMGIQLHSTSKTTNNPKL